MINVSLRPISEIKNIIGRKKKRNRTVMYLRNKKWFKDSNVLNGLSISYGEITSAKVSSNGVITINVKM